MEPQEEYEQDEILFRVDKVQVFLGDTDLGYGLLLLTTSKVQWTPANPNGYVQTWGYKDILMHAISSNPEGFHLPCIYCQLSGDDEEEVNELRFVPSDANIVPDLFSAFNKGAELNPDEEKEDEGDFFFNQDEIIGNLGGMSLAHGNGFGKGDSDEEIGEGDDQLDEENDKQHETEKGDET